MQLVPENMCSVLTCDICLTGTSNCIFNNGGDVDIRRKQDEEGEGDRDEDLPPLEEDGADECSRMEEVD